MRDGDPRVDGIERLPTLAKFRGATESRSGRLQVRVLTRGLATAIILLGIGFLHLGALVSPGIAPFDVCDGLGGVVQSLSASAEGRTIVASTSDGKLTTWNPGAYSDQAAACANGRESFRSAFCPNGKVVALAEADAGAVVWDLLAGHRVQLPPVPRPIRSLAFSADGARLAMADEVEIRLLNLATRQPCRPPFELCGVVSLAFSPDGRTLAVGTRDGALRLHAVAEWGPRPAIQAHVQPLSSLAFSSDGTLLATASHGEERIHVFSVASGRLLASLENRAIIQALAFAPGAGILAAAGHDGCVRIWDIARPRSPRVDLPQDGPATALAFSADGTTLACGGMGSIRVYRMADVAESFAR